MNKTQKHKKKLDAFLRIRKSTIKYGAGMTVLHLNEVIARLAKQLKLDYYSLK